MASTPLTPLSSLMFLGELARLSFTAQTATVFSIVTGGATVFSNTYYPDDNGMITVYNLDRLLEPHIGELHADFTFKAATSTLGPATIKVFRCRWGVDTTAANFIPSHFLTPMQGTRDTLDGRHETLSLYSTASEEAYAECRYYRDGSISTARVSLGTGSGARLLNVSPGRFVNATKGRLFAYTVVCGARRASYRVLAYRGETADAFIFRNCFNAWEVLYLTGTRETNPQYTRSSAHIGGYLRNYLIKEEVTRRSFTGPLPEGMEAVAMNLADSQAVFFLLPNGDAGEEVAVTDCDLKHDNTDSLTDLNFSYRGAALTYRLADDRTARLRVPRPPRIFDDTFDQSYE